MSGTERLQATKVLISIFFSSLVWYVCTRVLEEDMISFKRLHFVWNSLFRADFSSSFWFVLLAFCFLHSFELLSCVQISPCFPVENGIQWAKPRDSSTLAKEASRRPRLQAHLVPDSGVSWIAKLALWWTFNGMGLDSRPGRQNLFFFRRKIFCRKVPTSDSCSSWTETLALMIYLAVVVICLLLKSNSVWAFNLQTQVSVRWWLG